MSGEAFKAFLEHNATRGDVVVLILAAMVILLLFLAIVWPKD